MCGSYGVHYREVLLRFRGSVAFRGMGPGALRVSDANPFQVIRDSTACLIGSKRLGSGLTDLRMVFGVCVCVCGT